MSGSISRSNNDIITTYSGQDPQGDIGDTSVMTSLATITSKTGWKDAKVDFNAKGDGTTIDTVTLSNAIASGVNRIFLPEGVYIIDWYLDLPNIPLFLFGVPGKTIIKSVNSSIYSLLRLYKAGQNYNDLYLYGITLDGSNAPYSSGKGFGVSIYADGGYSMTRFKVDNCRFINMPNSAITSNTATDVKISNSSFENCTSGSSGNQVIALTGITDLTIEKNRVVNGQGVGIATTSCNNVRVTNNFVNGLTGNNGIQSLNDTDFKAIGNHSYNNGFNGLEVDGTQGFEVIGNTFKGNNYHGLTVTSDGSTVQPSDGEVVGNRAFNNKFVGFSLIGAKNVTLGNNRAFANNQSNNSAYQYGIVIQKNTTKGISSTDIVLTGNISQGDATQKYGLGIVDDSDYVNANGNNFRNNGGTGSVNNTSTGTHNLVANNS